MGNNDREQLLGELVKEAPRTGDLVALPQRLATKGENVVQNLVRGAARHGGGDVAQHNLEHRAKRRGEPRAPAKLARIRDGWSEKRKRNEKRERKKKTQKQF